jgi:hypothetical protein
MLGGGEIMTSSSARSLRHHAGPRAARLAAALLCLAVGLASTPAWGKGPSRKQVDEALLRLPAADLALVTGAETAIQQSNASLDVANQDLDIARKDDRAAKSWVDASNAVLKAIGLDRKASEQAARLPALERLATEQVRSESSLKWRKARAAAAKDRIAYLQATISWTKTELSRLGLVLSEAKLLTYKASVADTPDLDEDIGKMVTKRGKAESNSGKARGKMEKAEVAWQSSAATAKALAPGR